MFDGYQKKNPKELGYRDDLKEFIRSELKRGQQNILFGPPRTHRVKKESGRHLADIGIDEDIGVELKLNLRKKAEMDRLEGQVSGFTREYSCIIVVLCGEVSEEIFEELKYRFKRSYANVGFGLGAHGPRVTVIRKDEVSMNRSKKVREPSGEYNLGGGKTKNSAKETISYIYEVR